MAYARTNKHGVGADVGAFAAALRDFQSAYDVATRPNGIQSSNPDPAVPVLNTAIAAAYLEAIADATLCAVGLQGYHDVGGNGGGTSGTAFVDATYTAMNWTAPIAKRYLVRVDISCATNPGADHVEFRLVVDGVAKPTTGQVYCYCAGPNIVTNAGWSIPVDFSAGAHTLKVQWKTFGGSGTVVSGASTRLQIAITG